MFGEKKTSRICINAAAAQKPPLSNSTLSASNARCRHLPRLSKIRQRRDRFVVYLPQGVSGGGDSRTSNANVSGASDNERTRVRCIGQGTQACQDHRTDWDG